MSRAKAASVEWRRSPFAQRRLLLKIILKFIVENQEEICRCLFLCLVFSFVLLSCPAPEPGGDPQVPPFGYCCVFLQARCASPDSSLPLRLLGQARGAGVASAAGCCKRRSSQAGAGRWLKGAHLMTSAEQLLATAAATSVTMQPPSQAHPLTCPHVHMLMLPLRHRVSAIDSGKPMVDAAFGEVIVTCEKIWWLVQQGERYLAPEARSAGTMVSGWVGWRWV